MKRFLMMTAAGCVCASAGFVSPNVASASSIDVLWTSGSAGYNSSIAALGAGQSDDAVSYDPNGDGSLSWNITFWNAGDTIDFTSYDVLVAGSSFDSIDFAGTVLSSKSDIEAARGSRTFLSGQDADFHYRFGLNNDNGPRGFLINAVNWAASGTDLGIVSMNDGWAGTGSTWWLDDDSFLKSELDGFAEYFQDESVFLGVGQEGFPVNEGLTSAGLSNWGTSSHAGFSVGIPGYTAINFEGSNSSGRPITIVTQGFAGGGTDGGDDTMVTVPLPATGWMLLAGLGALGVMRRRQRTS